MKIYTLLRGNFRRDISSAEIQEITGIMRTCGIFLLALDASGLPAHPGLSNEEVETYDRLVAHVLDH